MNRILLILSVVGFELIAGGTALPCTTFVLQGGERIYFGRNLDWFWDDCWGIVNQRNVQKASLLGQERSPAKRTSKYGSVTFNQGGQEMPSGGMNEAGLVVEQMTLGETQYPPATDPRPGIDMAQWIQYQLDNCRTVAEVIATDKKIRLERTWIPFGIHYLVCDAAGDCATIELLKGKTVCHRGPSLPYRALANDTYEKPLAYVKTHPVSLNSSGWLADAQSLNRFAWAARRAAAFQPGAPKQDLEYAMETLNQISQAGTVWQMVYDVPARRIHFRIKSNPKRRTLELKDLDFACTGPVKFADAQAKPSADGAVDFLDLSEERHRKYLEALLGRESLKEKFGDQTATIESMLRILRGYKCADRQP